MENQPNFSVRMEEKNMAYKLVVSTTETTITTRQNLDRHLRIIRDKGKTNVHGKTNCPFMALRLRYAHGNHKC
jgi:hypothetical protein